MANEHVFGGRRMLMGRGVSSRRLAREWTAVCSHMERRRRCLFLRGGFLRGFFCMLTSVRRGRIPLLRVYGFLHRHRSKRVKRKETSRLRQPCFLPRWGFRPGLSADSCEVSVKKLVSSSLRLGGCFFLVCRCPCWPCDSLAFAISNRTSRHTPSVMRLSWSYQDYTFGDMCVRVVNALRLRGSSLPWRFGCGRSVVARARLLSVHEFVWLVGGQVNSNPGHAGCHGCRCCIYLWKFRSTPQNTGGNHHGTKLGILNHRGGEGAAADEIDHQHSRHKEIFLREQIRLMLSKRFATKPSRMRLLPSARLTIVAIQTLM